MKKNSRNAKTKLIALAMLTALMIGALAGCTSTTEMTPIVSPSPSSSPSTLNPLNSVSPSASPNGTNPAASPSVQPSPSTSEQPAAPTLSSQESAALAGQCDARIAQISEIADSVTVMVGDTTLTGVTFATQYKGELTTRINGIIGDSVRTVAPSIANVKVTSDADLTSRIAALREKQKDGGSTNEVKDEFDQIKQTIK